MQPLTERHFSSATNNLSDAYLYNGDPVLTDYTLIILKFVTNKLWTLFQNEAWRVYWRSPRQSYELIFALLAQKNGFFKMKTFLCRALIKQNWKVWAITCTCTAARSLAGFSPFIIFMKSRQGAPCFLSFECWIFWPLFCRKFLSRVILSFCYLFDPMVKSGK